MSCLSLFEFVLNLGGNIRVFVEFVGSVFFVDFGLAQNPLLPTTSMLVSFEHHASISEVILDRSSAYSHSTISKG